MGRDAKSLCSEARRIVARHCRQDGLALQVLPGLHLMRFGWKSQPLVSTQLPCMALVLQGAKSVEFGTVHLEYGVGQYLLTSIDIPATSRIVHASRTQPLLAVGVDLDWLEFNQLMQRCGDLPRLAPQPGISIFEADGDLLEAVVRLLRLLDTPQHAGPLAPLVRQEILYRLLTGAAGARLLEICRHGSPSNRIASATRWIQQHYAEGFLVADLAHHIGMSPTSLHQHFKAVTGLTPIQYQRRIRLQEARRSMLLESLNIGEASVRAGYESHSQFSKDYRRYFGRLPKDDLAAHSRGAVPLLAYLPEATARS
ncbi:AraC family transcriptional regulator [Paludibaculum fermentans]|uniref:AraC family transcriptional regulator n=1 Tax=Paludibaculum fermentans TaxID=1473598 RepID=UPI003EB8B603